MTGRARFLWPSRQAGRAGASVQGISAVVAAGMLLQLVLTPSVMAAPDAVKAREQLRTGEYAPALESAVEALKDPFNDTEEWLCIQLESLLSQGKYPEALKAAEEALTREDRSVRVQWAAREAFLTNGAVQKADAALDTVERLFSSRRGGPRDVRSIVIYGRVLMLRGMDPKSILDKVFSVAQKMVPDAREPQLAAGGLALEKNDFALAAKTFAAGLKTFPDDPDFLWGLAMAYAPSDRKLMQANLEAALKKNPRHVPSLLRLADHCIDAEKYPEAAALLDRVAEVNPHRPEMWAYRAVLAHLKNDAAGEAAARAEALKFWPTNPQPDHLIGRKLSQKYRFAEGSARQKQALEFQPGYVSAEAQLASDLLRLGDEDEGWALASKVQKEDAYNVTSFNLMTLHDAMREDFTTLRNGDFIVRMASAEAPVYGQRVLELLGEARKKLGEKYGLEVVRPTIVEIFPTEKDFGVRTFGMPDNPGYLGVCFGRVVTATSPAARPDAAVNWESVLWHEFCHTVTLQATGNKMPRWLSEGISVYEERQADPSWGERMGAEYRAMILGGKLTPVGSLSGAFLAPPSPLHLQFAYFESSLVVEFIINRYGLDALKAVLKDLAAGRQINDSLAERVAPMETLERDFATHAKELAENLAPALNWDRPDPELLMPGAEEKLEAWVKERPGNLWALQREADELMVSDEKAVLVRQTAGVTVRYEDKDRWQRAKAPLQKLIDLYPAQTGSDSALALMARVHRQLNETAEEKAVLTKLTAQESAALEPTQRLMALASADDDWATVTRQAKRYLAVNPLVPTGWKYLAEAAEHTGDSSTVVTACRSQLALKPPSTAELHYQLARALHRSGSEEARREVLMALEETPRHRAALKLLQEIPPLSAPPATPPSAAQPAPANGSKP